jgi:hypothetical protein
MAFMDSPKYSLPNAAEFVPSHYSDCCLYLWNGLHDMGYGTRSYLLARGGSGSSGGSQPQLGTCCLSTSGGIISRTLLVINKQDMANPDQVLTSTSMATSLIPTAENVTTLWGNVSPRQVLLHQNLKIRLAYLQQILL